MMHRIYAASYAVYYWSDWLFLAAFAALFVIPFTSLDARFAAWCIALLIAFVSLAARGASEALCRALLRRQRPNANSPKRKPAGSSFSNSKGALHISPMRQHISPPNASNRASRHGGPIATEVEVSSSTGDLDSGRDASSIAQ